MSISPLRHLRSAAASIACMFLLALLVGACMEPPPPAASSPTLADQPPDGHASAGPTSGPGGAQPAAPTLSLVGHADLGGHGYTGNVAALGSFAYVGSWFWGGHCPALGVRVVDISDPASPRAVATTARYDGTSAEHVVVRQVATPAFEGTLLAVGIQRCGRAGPPAPAGLALVDVSDPRSPREMGFFDVGLGVGGVHELDLVVQGSRVLALLAVPDSEDVSPTGDFQIVDVSDPTSPVRLFDWGATARLGETGGIGCQQAIYAHSVRSGGNGTRAYVSYWDAGVFIFDITDPSIPRMVGRLRDTSFEGNMHSVDEALTGYLLTADEVGFRGRSPALRVGARTATDQLDLFGCEASDRVPLPVGDSFEGPLVDLGDGCGAVSRHDGAIALVDASVARCRLGEKTRVAQDSGAAAIVVIHPNGPATLHARQSEIPFLSNPGEIVLPVAVIGHEDGVRLRALATTTAVDLVLPAARPSGGMGIWDIRDPARPVRVAYYRTPRADDYPPDATGGFTIHNPLGFGRYALASWYADGIRLLDLADPAHPREVAAFVPPAMPDPAGRQPTAPMVWGVAAVGDVVLASDINGGLYVLRLRGIPAG